MNLIEKAARSVSYEVDKKARAMGCAHELLHLPVEEKVRQIQRREGHTDCFFWNKPLEPSSHNPLLCAIDACCWKPACDIYRKLTHEDYEEPGRPGDWDPGTVGGGGGVY